MATSKTLTPTNVTIQIPEFTDQPDQRVNSNCIDKEADAINALNSNLSWESVTAAAGTNVTINTQSAFKLGKILFVYMRWTATANISPYATIATTPHAAKMAWNAPLINDANVVIASNGIYADAGNYAIRASTTIPAGTYRTFVIIPIS